MQEENISRAIIVVQSGMTPSAKQVTGPDLLMIDFTYQLTNWTKEAHQFV